MGMHNKKQKTSTLTETLNYVSKDGLVAVVTKRRPRRFPQHDYPVVCMRFRARKGSRIQVLEDNAGVEVLLTHAEVSAHLEALNVADVDAAYTWKVIPEKSPERKAHWQRLNDRRQQG